MNPIKIEKGAIEALKRTIRLHDKMDELLQEDDKGPSWDGDIYIYSDSDLKSEHIKYRIPTQVKGRNDESLLKRSSITYPVKYKNLRNYRNDGGVCYFVIAISNDGERASIFYSALTPIKLEAYLKGTEGKAPEQTKNIPLRRLKNNDKNELHKILLQFGFDSKEQGTGELVRKAISIKDIEKIDSIRTTTYAWSEQEAIKSMVAGEACLYGHLSDVDIWVPFSYEMQKSMDVVTSRMINKPFGIDGIVYYEKFIMRLDKNGVFTIQLSENLTLNTKTNKVDFRPVMELDSIIKDIKFLRAMEVGNRLYIGQDVLATFNNVSLGDDLKEAIDFYIRLKQAVDTFGIKLSKKFAEFDSKEWEAVNRLIGLLNGKIKPKNETAWYMWWWEGKVVPFFVAMFPDGKVIVENGLHLQHYKFTLGDSDYQVPALIMFKRDVWENLYDVDESLLLEELAKGEFNVETEGEFSLAFVEILSAYDTTKNEKYYDLAKIIADKLLQINPQSDYWKINRLQMLKRKRILSEEELLELENMEQGASDMKLLCAINILLENKRDAQKNLNDMEKADREMFITYPIYNLL